MSTDTHTIAVPRPGGLSTSVDEHGNPAIGKLAEAMAKAQSQFTAVAKNRQVEIRTKTGRTIRFNYAELPDILAMVRPGLAANGLFLCQPPEILGSGTLKVSASLFHSSGQWMSTTLSTTIDPRDPKSLGAAMTYLRRYAVTALLGIATGDESEAIEAGEKEDNPIRDRIESDRARRELERDHKRKMAAASAKASGDFEQEKARLNRERKDYFDKLLDDLGYGQNRFDRWLRDQEIHSELGIWSKALIATVVAILKTARSHEFGLTEVDCWLAGGAPIGKLTDAQLESVLRTVKADDWAAAVRACQPGVAAR